MTITADLPDSGLMKIHRPVWHHIAICILVMQAIAALLVGRPMAVSSAEIFLGILHLIISLAGLWIFGHAVAERLIPGCANDSIEKHLAAIVVGMAAWSLGGQFLGLFGGFHFTPAVLLIAFLGIGGVLLTRARLKPPAATSISVDERGRWPILLLIIIVLRFAAPWGGGFGGEGYAVFEEPDSITGYLAYAVHLIQTGHLHMPFRIEMTYPFMPTGWMILWASILLPIEGTDYLLRFVQIPAVFFSLLAFYVATRKAGASPTASLLASCVVAWQPFLRLREVFAVGRTDQWMLFSLVAALALLLGALREGGRGRWILAGCGAGLALGMKPDALIYLVGLAIPALLFPTRFPRFLFSAIVAMILIGGYGYIRNWMTMGNPIFPIPIIVLGSTVFPGDPSMLGSAMIPSSWLSLHTHLRIFKDGFDFSQASTAIIVCGWFLFLLHARRRPWRIDTLVLGLFPLALYLLYLLHPQPLPRRLFFPLITAAVPLALFLDGIGVPRLGAVIQRRLTRYVGAIGWKPARMKIRYWKFLFLGVLLLLLGLVPNRIIDYQRVRPTLMAGITGPAHYPFLNYHTISPLWAAVDELTATSSATVALINVNLWYPFFGNRLANRVIHIPRHGCRGRAVWGWGERVVHPFLPVEREGFEERLSDAEVDLIVVARGAPEVEWLESLGAALLAEAPDGLLFTRPPKSRPMESRTEFAPSS